MPSQKNVQLTGRIENLIFYRVGDKYYVRTCPGKVRQTKATKKRSGEFGKASSLGKCLRQQLLPAIPFPSDNKMQTRFVSALFQWLRSEYDAAKTCPDVHYINHFQFTECSAVTHRWNVSLKITNPEPGLLQLVIPAFVPSRAIFAPAGTVSVNCNIAVGASNITSCVASGGTFTSIVFDYNDTAVPEQIITFPVPTAQGSLVVTAISLEYFVLKNGHLEKTKNKAFMPAGVVSAMYF